MPTAEPTVVSSLAAIVLREVVTDPLPARASLATPKSSTLAWPRRVMKRLAGLMSRWMTPALCAASSASAICDAELEQVVERQRPARDARLERLALEQLHHHELLAVVLADVVQRADVRMAQRRDDARFAQEAIHRLRDRSRPRRAAA